MQLIRNSYNLAERHRGCTVTFGNFDGVHRGHQAMLRALPSPALVITFEPHPQEFLHPPGPPRLTCWHEKVRYIQQYDIDYLLCLSFNRKLAELSAQAFIEELLIQRLNARHVFVGKDVRFGYQRRGDMRLLRRFFKVTMAEDVLHAGERISSTRVRTALGKGDLVLAEQLLGRPYSVQGRVVKGHQRGRLLDFPTANVQLNRTQPALTGVFAVRANGMPGVANLGIRPTVGGGHPTLEVHLLDFAADLYHQRLHVEFLKKLREERCFHSLEALKTQISRDVAKAQAFFCA